MPSPEPVHFGRFSSPIHSTYLLSTQKGDNEMTKPSCLCIKLVES